MRALPAVIAIAITQLKTLAGPAAEAAQSFIALAQRRLAAGQAMAAAQHLLAPAQGAH